MLSKASHPNLRQLVRSRSEDLEGPLGNEGKKNLVRKKEVQYRTSSKQKKKKKKKKKETTRPGKD